MSKRKFRPKKKYSDPNSPVNIPLTSKPVAVYYRQSTAAQVGNHSTSIQTIDMVEELMRRGWDKDQIILIDTDEGISGTTRIDERQGMKRLFELIVDEEIGAVACQDEDRLFRDVTQIQVNIFIDACRKSNVQVITPSVTYNFSDPRQGDHYARQFRFKSEMAAEYIKSYILGRLVPAKRRLRRQGKWSGAATPAGYMVDMREHLPNGEENPNCRKFVPFDPYASIVREHFRVFLECSGHIRAAMRQIREERLSFPDVDPPDGFKMNSQLKRRKIGCYVNRGNFVRLLTNPVYIGHWMTSGSIEIWDNHEPIVDKKTFMRAFNFLSPYTLTGDENPDYNPAYQHERYDNDAAKEEVDRPLCIDFIFTEFKEGKKSTAGLIFERRNKCYVYVGQRSTIEGGELEWARRAEWIDQIVVYHFKKKLQATFDMSNWQDSIHEANDLIQRERKLKRQQLETVQEEKRNIVASLTQLSIPKLIQEVEEKYEQLEREENRLQQELSRVKHVR